MRCVKSRESRSASAARPNQNICVGESCAPAIPLFFILASRSGAFYDDNTAPVRRENLLRNGRPGASGSPGDCTPHF